MEVFIGILLALFGLIVFISIGYEISLLIRFVRNYTRYPEPGDVIIQNFKRDNPFFEAEDKYETITEVKKNHKGELYFKSYTSDKNGVKSRKQSSYVLEHTDGKWFDRSDWKIVNHVELNK